MLAWIVFVSAVGWAADPTAGISTPGSTLYPNAGLTRRATHIGPGEDLLVCAAVDSAAGFAYFGTDTFPGKIVKVDLSTFSRVGSLELGIDESSVRTALMDPARGVAYFSCTSGYSIWESTRVIKIDLATFSRVADITLPASDGIACSAAIDPAAGFAYYGTVPGKVVKVNLTTFAKVGTLSLNSGEIDLASAVIDAANSFAYFGTNTWPGIVVKVNLATFTRVGAITLPSGDGILGCGVLDADRGALYFGAGASPAKVVKIDLATFSRSEVLEVPSCCYFWSAQYDPGRGAIYFGGGTLPASLTRIDVSSTSGLSFVGDIEFEEGLLSVKSLVIDSTTDAAYCGFLTSPGEIHRVNLTSFTTSGSISLQGGEDSYRGAILDELTGDAYFHSLNPPGRIFKVNLETNTPTLIYEPEPEWQTTLTSIDPAGKKLYCRQYKNYSRAIRFDLTTLTENGVLTYGAEEIEPSIGVVDPGKDAGFFVAGYPTAQLLKTRLSTFDCQTSVTLDPDTYASTMLMDPLRGAVYLAGGSSYGQIWKYDADTMTKVGRLDLTGDPAGIVAGVLEPEEGFGYFLVNVSTQRVVKIDLDTFTRVGALDLTLYTQYQSCMVLDQIHRAVYLSSSTNPSRLEKVNLKSFSHAGSYTLNYEDKTPITGVCDGSRGILCFGNSSRPGRLYSFDATQKGYLKASRLTLSQKGIVKNFMFRSHEALGNVRLALYNDLEPKQLVWESGLTTNTLAGADLTIPVSEGQPSALTLDPGVYWIAWQVDTTFDVPSYRAGSSGAGFYVRMPFGPSPASIAAGDLVSTSENWTEYFSYEPVAGVDWKQME